MNLVGNDIIGNACKGISSTIFSYGQTGAGKRYTLFGYGKNVGLVGNLAYELFERIKNDSNYGISFKVTLEMLEIYI